MPFEAYATLFIDYVFLILILALADRVRGADLNDRTQESFMKKIIGLIAISAFVVTACSTNTGTNGNVSNQPEAVPTAAQAVWDKSYGGADKSYDTELLRLRELIAPKFQTLKFDDKVTGKTMTYNLFTPKDYDRSKRYPLVLFMADGSTTGKGAQAPLKQGYGGIIWATDESQSKNPSFVLVPAYVGPENVVNDQWEVSDEVEMTMRLLDHVVAQHSIDKNRLYTTGQSMGGMMSFYFNTKYPDLFAASLFVGSQWDINVLGPLANRKFFYIVSAGDEKASAGMQQVGEMLKSKGVSFGTTEFAADLPDAEQEKLVQELISKGYKINFVQFTKGTVAPATAQGGGVEHMYSFDHAYKLESVRNWLFKQSKDQ